MVMTMYGWLLLFMALFSRYRVGLRKHSERAAINTPLQGGAADIVMKVASNLFFEHNSNAYVA